MNAARNKLAAYVPLWRAAVSAPEGDDQPLLGLLLLAIAIVVNSLIFMFAPVPGRMSFSLAAGIPLAVYASIMWLRFLRGAMLQITQANGMLVPGLVSRLRHIAMLAYAAAVLCWMVLASGLPRGDTLLVGVCAAMTAVMLATARPYVFYTGVTLLWLWSMAERFFEFPSLGTPGGARFIWALLTALLTGWAFRVTFSEGIQSVHQRSVALRLANVFTEPAGQVFGVRGMGGGRRYARLLQGDIMAGKAGDLMLHALGPRNHRYDFLWSLPLTALFGIVPKLVSDQLWPGHTPFLVEICGVLSIGAFAVMALACPYRFTFSLPASGAEQGLFRLTPMAPAAPALNRLLAGKLLRICLAEWAACTALMLAVSLVWKLPSFAMALLTVHMLTLLAAAGWPLRDYAHPGNPRRWQGIAQCSLMLALGVATVLLYKMIGPLVLALPIGVSAAMIVWRWRAMTAAPVAFPAGRM